MRKRACVFSTAFVKEGIDPRVKDEWESAFGAKAPFAKLRQMWKTQHCVQVDPYNTGCPYPEVDCSLAFLVAVQRTAGAHPDRPTGYFRAVAHSMGLDRADNKPLARDTLTRTDVHKEGHPGGRGSGSEEGQDVRRSTTRPVRIGELLGAFDSRSHQISTTDEQEGDK
jgi:hypothetical protein